MKKDSKINASPLVKMFTTEEQRQDKKLECVQEIAANELQPFNNHPFQVKNDEDMKRLCDSISEYGILTPLIARPKDGGDYEIVSGHRRKAAAEILGLDKLPVLVHDMTDDEAVILMIDSNIQRENLLPSEKAFAYKMKSEAMKRQAGRPSKENMRQVGTDLIGVRSDSLLAEKTDDSARTIQRYIRLTELAKPILDLVDNQRIAFSPAVELSYLTKEEQAELWDIMQQEDCTPSLSQAVRMKKLSQEVNLTPETMSAIMGEEKANQKPQVRISTEKLAKYFPKGYTSEQMKKSIIAMLEERKRKLEKSRSDAR